ncbi:penicillin-binding protein 1A [Sungkyunkwania multivorans]|uniref:Penicillin-binding protein 1A n=1 Tax=Sungkyunkwania multivorans TaxID=1173618 RepID=A0ABW3D181_9FLAO
MAIKKTKKKGMSAKETQNNWKYIKWFWILFASGFAMVTLVFLMASWGWLGEMPTFEELENPETNLATEIISSDNKTLGKFFNENRTPISYNDLPENLIKALVATEDERYYDHSGIDARGTLRAMVKMGKGGGASTITQQLAKLLFTKKASQNSAERVLQKVKEWVIAIRLERQYTKEEIITMYLNKFGFLFQAHGIRSASRIYFGKEPKDLKLEESAVLVAMLKNPRQYNPHRKISFEKSKQRRNQVFVQMYKNGLLGEAEKDSLQQLPLKLNFSPEEHSDGLATYFRAYLKDFVKDWIEKNPKPDGTNYNIYRDGLKIYATIDSRMQEYAEEAMKEHMKKLQAEFFVQNTKKRNRTAPFVDLERAQIEKTMKDAMRRSDRWRNMKNEGYSEKEIYASFEKKAEMKVFSWKGDIDTIMTPRDSIRYHKHFLRSGLMSMDPQTGHVKAWVGGYNYKHFQYDHVHQGRRQVGSTFKPFVYATAIDQLKLSPCDSLPDVLTCIPAGKYGNMEDWCPKNSGEKYGGYRTLKNALANSVNTITAQLMNQVGPEPVVTLAQNMGITSEELIPVPSIALGTPGISLFEMVGAYGTFANQGIYQKPVMVTRIEDKNGTILYEFTPETKDVLSKEAAYVTVNLMQGVTQHGSGMRLRHASQKNDIVYKEVVTGYPYQFDNPIAGKTGTTQNQSDGWFMGMVPNLVTGVWVGGEDRAVHFKSIAYGQGASMALPIWALYMKKCYENKDLEISKEDFEKPDNLKINVDCSRAVASDGLEDLFKNQDEDLEDLGF